MRNDQREASAVVLGDWVRAAGPGLRLENDHLVTATGPELLSPIPLDL